MNDISTSQMINVAVVIPDDDLRQQVTELLTQNYAVSDFPRLESFCKTSETFPVLLLCHQTLFEHKGLSLESLIHKCAGTRVLVFGPPIPLSRQIMALKHGARGYFSDELPLEKLLKAFDSIRHGEVWIERRAIAGLVDELAHTQEVSQEHQQLLDLLSVKEMEVAKLVSHGATNKMIANELSITERTVKAHLTTIFQKLNLPDRLALAIFFRDLRP